MALKSLRVQGDNEGGRGEELEVRRRDRMGPGRECGMGSLFSGKMGKLDIFLRLQIWMGVGK